MPKKVNRPATRTKSRPVRRPQRPAVQPERDNGNGAVTEMQASPATVPVAARPVAAAGASTSTVRRAPQRRAASAPMNYAYLRRDITLLAMLAPAMIVVVIIAYVFFH
ncbi:MAG: hypothetical protein NVS2B16_00010 [Chloroflexota bacterium]